MSARKLEMIQKSWPLAKAFSIARGSKIQADVLQVQISQGGLMGQGECVPYARYHESLESVGAQILSLKIAIEQGASREALQSLCPSGAARNAVDCALWDLEAKLANKRAWELAGIDAPQPVLTAYTISLESPEEMAISAKQAFEEKGQPLLKLKLGGQDDVSRLQKIRQAAPNARLIIDANEGWNAHNLFENIKACEDVGVELIEQPLPAHDDELLSDLKTSISICADESLHDLASLKKIEGKYSAINIKLDKTGGLTQALELAMAAQALKLKIMVGCMVGSSLAMAPAMILTPFAQYVDLDAPLLLSSDMPSPLSFDKGFVYPPLTFLWG